MGHNLVEAKIYAGLLSGDLKVEHGKRYKCPFCISERKGYCKITSLLRHALIVAGASANSEVKATHGALVKHLKNSIGKSSEPQSHQEAIDPRLPENRGKQYVLPWMGVLVNVPTKWEDGRRVGDSVSKLKEQLSRFCPVSVTALWTSRGHTGTAIVEFRNDWSGFGNARAFESYFMAEKHGKRDWKKRKNGYSGLFGWVAMEEDYRFHGPIGAHLRKNGDLKSINDLKNDRERKTGTLVAHLVSQVEVKDRHLNELECEYNGIITSLDKMVEEKEKLILSHEKSTNENYQQARGRSQAIIDKNQKLRLELNSKINEHDVKSNQPDDVSARTDCDRRITEQEKQMNAMKSNHLKMAMEEQDRAEENVLKRLQEQVREKKDILNKIEKLKGQLYKKKELEFDIQQIKGALDVRKHMPDGEGSKSKEMDRLSKELKEKEKELDKMQSRTNHLIVKDKESNDMLTKAREELEIGFHDLSTSGRAHIGIKLVGQLDPKLFLNACRQRPSEGYGEVHAGKLCSKWQAQINNSNWYPIKVVQVDGKEPAHSQSPDRAAAEIHGDGDRSSSEQSSRRKQRRRSAGAGRGVLERGSQVVPGPHPHLLHPRRAPTHRLHSGRDQARRHCLGRHRRHVRRQRGGRGDRRRCAEQLRQELGKVEHDPKDSSLDFLSSLKQHPQIAETKIAWLAKLFLWEPFFPVRAHDTLFHAMLLFSKHHRLNVVPVVESMNSSVIGFVTQNAVMELLLQSSGLEWLDKIAEKQLSEFRFASVRKPVLVYSDQTLADGLHILSKEKMEIAVIDRKTSCLIESIQCSDLYLILDDSSLFSKRMKISMEEFINVNNKTNSKCSTAENSSACKGQNILALRNTGQRGTSLPVSNRRSDTLKQAVEKLTSSRSSCSFIVDEQGHVEGVVTTRDIISVFSPPCMDSRIDGSTFFSAALEQAGCHVENGQIIQNSKSIKP